MLQALRIRAFYLSYEFEEKFSTEDSNLFLNDIIHPVVQVEN